MRRQKAISPSGGTCHPHDKGRAPPSGQHTPQVGLHIAPGIGRGEHHPRHAAPKADAPAAGHGAHLFHRHIAGGLGREGLDGIEPHCHKLRQEAAHGAIQMHGAAHPGSVEAFQPAAMGPGHVGLVEPAQVVAGEVIGKMHQGRPERADGVQHRCLLGLHEGQKLLYLLGIVHEQVGPLLHAGPFVEKGRQRAAGQGDGGHAVVCGPEGQAFAIVGHASRAQLAMFQEILQDGQVLRPRHRMPDDAYGAGFGQKAALLAQFAQRRAPEADGAEAFRHTFHLDGGIVLWLGQPELFVPVVGHDPQLPAKLEVALLRGPARIGQTPLGLAADPVTDIRRPDHLIRRVAVESLQESVAHQRLLQYSLRKRTPLATAASMMMRPFSAVACVGAP